VGTCPCGPLSSAFCEISFSEIKAVSKIFFKNFMSSEILSSVALLPVEEEKP